MKIIYGSIVTAGSGKLGGHVYARNKGGSYIRTKTKPLNPKTLAQSLVRNNFTSNSQAWRGLTASQRQAWISATVNFPKKGKLAETETLSGSQLFMRINNNLLNIEQATISLPPTPQAVPALSALSLAFSATASTATATFAPTPVPTGYSLVFQGTAPTSAGKYNVSNKFRNFYIDPAASASPSNIYASYVAKFGPAAVGQKVFIRTKLVDNTTGLESQWLEASTLAV